MSDDKFTRQDLFDLLAVDGHEEAEIKKALEELGVDPNAQEFDVDISDRVSKILNLAKSSIDQSKLLTPGGSLASIQEGAINIATEQLEVHGVSKETFKAILSIVASKTVAQAVAIHDFQMSLLGEIQQELDFQTLEEMKEQGFEEISFIYQLARNPELRQKITQEYGLRTPEELKQQVETTTTTLTPDFNAEEFLKEVGLAPEEKKSPQPQTIKDLQSLSKSLLQQHLKRSKLPTSA